ncbi:MAG TPA: 1-deoxy-D-xylulose-5-phosphate synthase N-terminal domain-containing protein [Anaerolineae bacterium]|nr:1-deoxy-D-xylulose-5-phosphate synthase N-terminal domain-containing protein [Anaerolineae bacterium]HMR64119.1 1-deoxy-D-xylulose-5-phosphate synthase N-terminal domain-containing protein [Anaerolineae bacterium]
MTLEEIKHLEQIALRVREHIIRMATNGGCFIGASLSCVELLVYLYTRFLNLTPHNLSDPQRDYLFLSKGHDVPALYGLFAELGLLEPHRLGHHLKLNDELYWHPNRAIPGVEFHAGSLGHLLPVAVGVALDCKLCGQSNRVVVICGDGELNEGSNWEACLVAAAYRLDNLIVIVDRNEFQANCPTEDLIPLEPLPAKFEAFGCATSRFDGHNFMALDEALRHVPFNPGQPNVLIADTVRGRGLPSLERRADRWFCNFSQPEIEQLLAELHGTHQAELHSEALVVR